MDLGRHMELVPGYHSHMGLVVVAVVAMGLDLRMVVVAVVGSKPLERK